MLYRPKLEFVCAFFGCAYAGVVPVPAYPANRNRPNPRLEAVAAAAGAEALLSTTDIIDRWHNREH